MLTSDSGDAVADFLPLQSAAMAGAVREAVVLVDAQQQIVAVDATARRMFGHGPGPGDLLGRPLSCLLPGWPWSETLPAGPVTVHALHADGHGVPAELSIAPLDLLVDGQHRALWALHLRDAVAARALRAEAAMLTERLRSVLELMPVAIWIVSDERVVYANRAAADLFGVAQGARLVGQSIHALMRTHAPTSLQAHLAQAAQSDARAGIVAGTVMRPDGQARDVEIVSAALPDHGRTVMQMVIIDVTENRAQAQEQAQHRAELRQLAASVVEAREEERRRIARELHDELGQRLTALKMEISSLRAHDPRHDDAGRFAGMLEMVDVTVAALRRIAADLRPLMLDDLGLNAAIEGLAREAARRMDIEVTLRLGHDDPPLAPGVDIALYRMVQEALTNIGRHARASDVHIALQHDGDELVLTVQDNGRGFPERALRSEGRYGLLGMRERALMLGGRLQIDNPAGGGGRITVHLPLSAGRPAQDNAA